IIIVIAGAAVFMASYNAKNKIVDRLGFKGCNDLITEQELEASTPWQAEDTDYFIGSYGAVEMDCDYYEKTSADKYHITFSLFTGGVQKLEDLARAWKASTGNTGSDATIMGSHSFSFKPSILGFVDKETGIVVWLRLEAEGRLTDADWNSLLSAAKAIDAKLKT
ncbi:MAG: hypothetical protein HY513_02745, partial [Candidatus Aenigmarchaeota archaeon]|nr:hypothetical protein [Candidatus Aenigmarchaeota archaeon]